MATRTEIERKFDLGRKLPLRARFGDVVAVRQRQCYPRSHPGEIRVRHEQIGGLDRYCLTVKTDGGLRRLEWDQEIPQEIFEMYWAAGCVRIVKVRRLVPFDGGVVAVDLYEYPQIRVIAEVEFQSDRDAKMIALPEWLGTAVEVTKDKRFKAKQVAQKGFPDLVMA